MTLYPMLLKMRAHACVRVQAQSFAMNVVNPFPNGADKPFPA